MLKKKNNSIATNRRAGYDYKVDCIAAEFKDWEVSW